MNLIGVPGGRVDDKKVMSTTRRSVSIKMQGILQNAVGEAEGVICTILGERAITC